MDSIPSTPSAAAGRTAVPRLDHGVTGNCRILGLVAPSTAVEWLCLPRFDSPSVFARLLDAKIGGTWRFLLGDAEPRGQLAYLQNTNVLRNVCRAGDVAFEVVDFAPRIPDGLGHRTPAEFVRVLRPLAGEPYLAVDFDPRPDYARAAPRFVEGDGQLRVEWSGVPLVLYTNLPIAYVTARRRFLLDRTVWFVLRYGERPERPTRDSVLSDLELTTVGWRRFAKSCALPPLAPAHVLRSALCLKLHTFEDTGAIIAAATTSIPEAMGTERTWDYRFCWLRDAAFVVEALRRLSHLAEGEAFIRFLRDVSEAGPLQPLYSIDGSRELEEQRLEHLAGFGGNGHVRIGNAAAEQRQNDLMGELVLCLDTVLGDPRLAGIDPLGTFPLVERLVEEAIRAAPTPDTSIWEFRTQLRHYTFSRAMCWAAIDRGAAIARRAGRAELADRWAALAAGERGAVLERGYSEHHGCFTQALDGQHPDASNLLLPTIGVVGARDPRFLSTLRAYEQQLTERGLMLRYRNPDDFGTTTSAFTICSFWWAEALALAGRLEDAVRVFDRLCAHANPLGLFSEDIEPESGALLGNFPQAYTHVGMIHAAMTIGDLLAAQDGRTRAWV